MNGIKRILVLSPHPDDAELGCGGTLVRYAQTADIRVVVLSMPDLHPEALEAHSRIGKRVTTGLYDFPGRELQDHRQAILQTILEEKERFHPDLVLLPSGQDMHQDHQVVHAEGLRACKHVSMLGYELPWNHLTFSSTAVIQFDETAMDTKLDALDAYESQRQRPYFQPGYMRSLATVRGGMIGAAYAEAFEVVRMTW